MTALPPAKDPSRVGDWLQTYTGRSFWPLDPRPGEVCIEDIAHALSMKCRYAGHTKRFYSVAEHSVLASFCVSPENALWALLHDAAEAYSADIPRPLKRHLPEWPAMEAKIMRAVCMHFGLPEQEPEEVTYMDYALTTDERAALMAPCERKWEELPPSLGVHIRALNPVAAELWFTERFNALTESSGE